MRQNFSTISFALWQFRASVSQKESCANDFSRTLVRGDVFPSPSRLRFRLAPLRPYTFSLLPSSLFRLFLIQASFPLRVPRVEFARPYLRCVPLVLSFCCFYYFLPFSRHFRREKGYSSLFRSPPRLFQPP